MDGRRGDCRRNRLRDALNPYGLGVKTARLAFLLRRTGCELSHVRDERSVFLMAPAAHLFLIVRTVVRPSPHDASARLPLPVAARRRRCFERPASPPFFSFKQTSQTNAHESTLLATDSDRRASRQALSKISNS
jgi:hypothetical protein